VLIGLILLFVCSVSAAEYNKSAIKADKTLPVIDELDLFRLGPDVIEIKWRISDNVGLSRYEIFKNDVRLKTKPTSGMNQASRFRDLMAEDGDKYDFVVYDLAKNRIKKTLVLNKTKETEEIKKAINAVSKPNLTANTTVNTSTIEETEELNSSFESPKPMGSILLAAILALVVVFVFWQLVNLRSGKKSSKHELYKEMGLHKYLDKRKAKKKK